MWTTRDVIIPEVEDVRCREIIEMDLSVPSVNIEECTNRILVRIRKLLHGL